MIIFPGLHLHKGNFRNLCPARTKNGQDGFRYSLNGFVSCREMPQTESLKLYPDNVIETQYIKLQNTGNELGK